MSNSLGCPDYQLHLSQSRGPSNTHFGRWKHDTNHEKHCDSQLDAKLLPDVIIELYSFTMFHFCLVVWKLRCCDPHLPHLGLRWNPSSTWRLWPKLKQLSDLTKFNRFDWNVHRKIPLLEPLINFWVCVFRTSKEQMTKLNSIYIGTNMCENWETCKTVTIFTTKTDCSNLWKMCLRRATEGWKSQHPCLDSQHSQLRACFFFFFWFWMVP